MREDTNPREVVQARGRASSKGRSDVIGLELLIMDIHSGHYAHVITSSHSSCIAHAYKEERLSTSRLSRAVQMDGGTCIVYIIYTLTHFIN